MPLLTFWPHSFLFQADRGRCLARASGEKALGKKPRPDFESSTCTGPTVQRERRQYRGLFSLEQSTCLSRAAALIGNAKSCHKMATLHIRIGEREREAVLERD